jgi:thiamine biosynthesis lipoprotein
MVADAMATALMVMGEREGLRFAQERAISALFLCRAPDGITSNGTGAFAKVARAG